jgi:hypothetical protein
MDFYRGRGDDMKQYSTLRRAMGELGEVPGHRSWGVGGGVAQSLPTDRHVGVYDKPPATARLSVTPWLFTGRR